MDLEYNGNDKIDCVEAAKQEADFAYFLNFSIKVPPISPPPPHHMRKFHYRIVMLFFRFPNLAKNIFNLEFSWRRKQTDWTN